MFKVNDNYLKLPGSYLFSTIAKKVNCIYSRLIRQKADHPSGYRRCDTADRTGCD